MLNPAIKNPNFLGGEPLAHRRHACDASVSAFDGGEKWTALGVTRDDENAESTGLGGAGAAVEMGPLRLRPTIMAGDAFRRQDGFDVPWEIYSPLHSDANFAGRQNITPRQ